MPDITTGSNWTVASGGTIASPLFDGGTLELEPGAIVLDGIGLTGEFSQLVIDPRALSAIAPDGNATIGYGMLAEKPTITVGDVVTVLNGGTITDPRIDRGTLMVSGGTEIISIGGTSIDAVVTDRGSQTVANGGTVTTATIQNGSPQVLNAGAVAYDVTVGDPSVQTAASGAIANDTTLTADGEQDVYGVANNTVIEDGSAQVVYTGGTALGSVIEQGDTLVLNGGTVLGATLETGGTLSFGALAYPGSITGMIVGGDMLEVLSRGSIVLTAQLTGDYSSDVLNLTVGLDGSTDLTLCFYPGTHVTTPAGEVCGRGVAGWRSGADDERREAGALDRPEPCQHALCL